MSHGPAHCQCKRSLRELCHTYSSKFSAPQAPSRISNYVLQDYVQPCRKLRRSSIVSLFWQYKRKISEALLTFEERSPEWRTEAWATGTEEWPHYTLDSEDRGRRSVCRSPTHSRNSKEQQALICLTGRVWINHGLSEENGLTSSLQEAPWSVCPALPPGSNQKAHFVSLASASSEGSDFLSREGPGSQALFLNHICSIQ